ncbi:MAP kinase-activating death domain protein isoformX3 [Anopheles sinensis]|uniref:MAP kinase-activating death domain protein isoformX3 n=1 Tax=Anopheles sinensis TaxID=74873 RepID=A0A084VY24_ANOSI|nr:MAP kinase-activating death domain protein isoformX3 [Anopheles sinensis]
MSFRLTAIKLPGITMFYESPLPTSRAFVRFLGRGNGDTCRGDPGMVGSTASRPGVVSQVTTPLGRLKNTSHNPLHFQAYRLGIARGSCRAIESA